MNPHGPIPTLKNPNSVLLNADTNFQERLSVLIGPYWGTYGTVYRVLQPLLVPPFFSKPTQWPTPRDAVQARSAGALDSSGSHEA